MSTFSPSFLPFEQDRLDQEAAQKAAQENARRQARETVIAERIARKKKEALEKSHRRAIRSIKAADKAKKSAFWAKCGINSYPLSSGWTHCHKCGARLNFRPGNESQTSPQICNPQLKHSRQVAA